ncbi:alpha-L-rhamnosidase C-terminal domain-containing protein [Cohnella soli]|uniref:Alpha-L-rhamnosidase C-terminal domain-containing protein n=1 Tax=Cohnella soli TaxID=425005 RepID=A0ABW0I1U7_9BACL
MEQHRAWKAHWIWKQRTEVSATEGRHELVYFRRSFALPAEGAGKLVVRVSADSRYRLYLNGKSVSVGPCKGDRYTHHYETVDLTEHLLPGMNVLAAKVLHFTVSEPFVLGVGGPASVWRSNTGAFFLEGDLVDENGCAIIELSSSEQWVCLEDRALSFHPGELETLYVGGAERVDGASLPHGWEEIEYDDRHWDKASVIADAYDSTYGQLTPWPLTPRPIPPLYEEERGFRSIARIVGGQEAEPSFHLPHDGRMPEGDQGFELKAGERFLIELDAGELTTGYLRLAMTGGRGSSVRILCAECYEDPPESTIRRNKGIRDDHSKGLLLGEEDIYSIQGFGDPSLGRYESYEPFWFRTFRFVRLSVEVGSEPLVIHRFNYRETGYPLEIEADFRSSDESLRKLWDISMNTLKRCMHETYEDCPFYEQMQYAMDTRLQVLFTYHLSADDRLARKAIFDFHSSLLPNGMLQSRYPSLYPQIIPGFSFYWIMMVHDHYRYFADADLVRMYLPTMDAVLGWFERQLDERGLVDRMPPQYWSFVDWVEQWRDFAGVPAANLKGPLAILSMQYAAALQAAAELNDFAGRTATAEEYRLRADSLNEAIRANCWSEGRQMFRDGPEAEEFSQHAQIWAVLSGTASGAEARKLLETMMVDQSLPVVSYAMAFYLFRAMSDTGLYERSFPLWDTWRRLAELNLTTWVEDPVSQRSDCHGWGATPLYEFPAEILGVKPAEPGFKRIKVQPRLGHLAWAEGKVATAQGTVYVKWELDGEDRFRLRVQGPRHIPVTVELPNGQSFTVPEADPYEVVVHLRSAGSIVG